MITLFTGAPGAGKTCHAVKFMRDEILKKPSVKLYVHGIPGLKIPHVDIYCKADECDVCQKALDKMVVPERIYVKKEQLASNINELQDEFECINELEIMIMQQKIDNLLFVEDWQDWGIAAAKESGSNSDDQGILFFMDECQRFWRSASSGAKIPPHISALETHRHYGINFIVVTQSPNLIHMNVRRLTSKHIHLIRSWKGDYSYEWSECSDNTSSTYGSVKARYKLEQEIFNLYISSSLHVPIERRKPWVVYVLPFIVALFLYLIYSIFFSLSNLSVFGGKSKEKEQQQQQNEQQQQPKEGQGIKPTGLMDTSLPTNQNESSFNAFNETWFDFKPRIEGKPETAPAYDGQNRQTLTHPVLTDCRIDKEVVFPKGVELKEKTVYQDNSGNVLSSHDVKQLDNQISYLENKLHKYSEKQSYFAGDPDLLKMAALQDLIHQKIKYKDSIYSYSQSYYALGNKTLSIDSNGNPKGTQYIEECNCYTQQDTIYDTTKAFCLAYTQHKVFNPYKADANSVSQNALVASSQQQPPSSEFFKTPSP